MSKNQVVCRFAPSPSGELHIGNLRTALYSWLYARQNNGTFILRIENTDRKRCKDEYTQKIINILKTMGLDWDLFYEQSHRLHIYWTYAHNLMIKNKAYICNCPKDFEGECKCYENYYPESANKLTNDNEYCIKLRVKELNRDIGCHDEIRGNINFNTNNLEDIVLFKSDGYPTYHLASCVDDILMEVTDVFRGEEWISSFPYHKLIYEGLNYKTPKYYHLPLILNVNGQKLSKRDDDFTIDSLLMDGILPSAIINYTALLGWHPSGNEEFFTLPELLKNFNTTRLNTSSSRYDYKKLKNLNLKHSKTDQGIKEYYQMYKNQYEEKRLQHLLYVFQNGMEVSRLMSKITNLNREQITIDQDKIKFFKILIKELKEMKDHRFNGNADIFLGATETNIVLQNILNCGYNNKQTNEWIREILTGETKGLPAEILLSIFTIQELLNMFEKNRISVSKGII